MPFPRIGGDPGSVKECGILIVRYQVVDERDREVPSTAGVPQARCREDNRTFCVAEII